MGLKTLLAKPIVNKAYKNILKNAETAVEDQRKVFQKLISQAQNTLFAKDFNFIQITSPFEFAQAVPLQDYEQMKSYIEQIKAGKQNILWRGTPLYFAKTSGTTSGIKYIPISKESISNHIDTARHALICYLAQKNNFDLLNHKMIFLSGSPTLERIHQIPTGRLSGIVNHHIPSYLKRNQVPKFSTNCIEDWEEKVEKIVEETSQISMSLISGIPPWVQMYFDKLIEKHNKSICEIFPNFEILVHGGVNIEPYKQKLLNSLGKEIQMIETFPASEGFFAYQDTLDYKGLLLNTNSGIFFEFVPLNEIHLAQPKRLTLEQVELNQNYALIISNNAGLWAYNIGDTVKFVSLQPYRIVVTGRIKHFISAFGEHVIAEEVEYAMKKTSEKFPAEIIEFTVAPMIASDKGKSYHEWFIAFEKLPNDIEQFATYLNEMMCQKNIYYKDLIQGQILSKLKITALQKNAFQDYMKSIGKLGGQNKIPRLSNDRTIADALVKYVWQS